MYLPPHRHYYANLSVRPAKMHIFSHKQITHCPDQKQALIQNSARKNTLPLTETRKRKGVELNIQLSYQSQHVHTGKAGTSCHSARHLKHF